MIEIFTKNHTVDLKKVLGIILKNKKLHFKILTISLLLGLIFSISKKNYYTCSAKFIPQTSNDLKANSSISGIASLAGINLSEINKSNLIPPSLFPEIVSSVEFKLELLNSVFKNENLNVREYLLSNKSFSLIGSIKEKFSSLIRYFIDFFKKDLNQNNDSVNYIYEISEEDNELFKLLNKKLNVEADEDDRLIIISFTDNNKFKAAEITNIAKDILDSKVVEINISSSKEVLDFTLNEYNNKKKMHEKLQDDIANFIDKNQNITSSLFRNKLDRMNTDLNISQGVLQQLANQVEQEKLKVSKDTPILTVINSVTIPFEKSGPNRFLIIIVYSLVGLFISFFYTMIKELF